MILDSTLKLSAAQAATASAATGNTVDFGHTTPDLGQSPQPLYAVLSVAAGFAVLTSLRFPFQLRDPEAGPFADVIRGAALVPADFKEGAH